MPREYALSNDKTLFLSPSDVCNDGHSLLVGGSVQALHAQKVKILMKSINALKLELEALKVRMRNTQGRPCHAAHPHWALGMVFSGISQKQMLKPRG
jgi:hypothetical protein